MKETVTVFYKGESSRGMGYSTKQAKLDAFFNWVKGKHVGFKEINKLRKDFMKKGKVTGD